MSHVLAPSFRHGIHPAEHKEATEHLPIERMPFVETYVLPLSQHIGAPCKPVVKPGDRVRRGQMIAEPGAFVSTTLHSPVSGRVKDIAPRHHPNGNVLLLAIEIAADPFSDQRYEEKPPIDWRALSEESFVLHLQRAGLVGMGGAAFPTHVKYQVPAGRVLRTLVINGCECEPFLTTDHRLMVERPAAVLRGVEIAATRLGVEETVIGVELNKPESIAALQREVDQREGRAGPPVRVVPLRVKYPQGAEKMLIEALFGIEVPSGKLPLDVGMLVNNVATMAGIADYFDTGRPLIERVITVAGPGIPRPSNLLVPVGTPIRAVVDHCGGLGAETRELVMGGPMMGMPLASLDVPVLKGTSGLLAFTEEARLPNEYTCIRCGRCVEACPQFLNPSRLARLARAGRWDEVERFYVNDCVECGSCSFACPSGIPIVQLIRVAKSRLRERKSK